jgi:hypothetical protein
MIVVIVKSFLKESRCLENGREIAQVNEAAEDFKMVVETVAIFKYYSMKDNV